MKKLHLILYLMIFGSIVTFSQNEETLTLSKGRYNEILAYNKYEQVGSVIMDIKTKTIAGFVDRDTMLLKAIKEPDATTRWFVIDAFAGKYHSLSPYNYAANNPILYIDINGDSLNIGLIQRHDAANSTSHLQTITNDLSTQTGLNYSVASSGQLDYQKDASGNPVISTTTDAAGNTVQVGSQEARDIMVDAISNTTTAYARITTGRSSSIVGGALININPSQINSMTSSAQNVDPNTLGMGMTFMHETLHSTLGGGLRDVPAGSGLGPTGPVVNRMNIVRSEMNSQGYNYGQRTSYEAVTFSPTSTPAFLPFDTNSLNNLQRGLVPASTNKYLQF